jgi:hypothetical protein
MASGVVVSDHAGSLLLGERLGLSDHLDYTLAVCSIFTSKSFVINGIAQLKIGKNVSRTKKLKTCFFGLFDVLRKVLASPGVTVSSTINKWGPSVMKKSVGTTSTIPVLFRDDSFLKEECQ